MLKYDVILSQHAIECKNWDVQKQHNREVELESIRQQRIDEYVSRPRSNMMDSDASRL